MRQNTPSSDWLNKQSWGRPAPVQPPQLSSQLTFRSGDILSLTLNPAKKALSCVINNYQSFIIFNNLEVDKEIKWKIVFGLENLGDSVTLMNFYSHS